MRTDHVWAATQNFMAAQDALRYTFAIPRPAGFAGLGAHAWRNAEIPRRATKHEFQSPAMTRL